MPKGKRKERYNIMRKENYATFKEGFIEAICRELSARGYQFDTTETTVTKVNNTYEALTITPVGKNIGVNINITEMYSFYEDEETFEEVVRKAVEVTEKGLGNTEIMTSVDNGLITDFDLMKNSLIMQIISADDNAELLKTVPHKTIEDMAVVCRFVLAHEPLGSVLVTNDILKVMGISEEQLFEAAEEIAPQNEPAIVTRLSEMLMNLMKVQGVPDECLPPMEEEQLYVANNPSGFNGAGVLAYPGFLKEQGERFGSFYVLPSSIHEVLILPDSMATDKDPEILKAMVMDVNSGVLDPKDKLTDNIYHYDAESGIFETGEKYVARCSKTAAMG